nr:uncharacterized protein LOC105486055 [Macaca nemestrina]
MIQPGSRILLCTMGVYEDRQTCQAPSGKLCVSFTLEGQNIIWRWRVLLRVSSTGVHSLGWVPVPVCGLLGTGPHSRRQRTKIGGFLLSALGCVITLGLPSVLTYCYPDAKAGGQGQGVRCFTSLSENCIIQTVSSQPDGTPRLCEFLSAQQAHLPVGFQRLFSLFFSALDTRALITQPNSAAEHSPVSSWLGPGPPHLSKSPKMERLRPVIRASGCKGDKWAESTLYSSWFSL